MHKLSALFFVLLFASALAVVEVDRPMTAEDEIMMRELAWAEKAMEGYKRHHGDMPLRSSINAIHVHTEEWKNASIDSIRRKPPSSQEDIEAERGNLRKRKHALGNR